MTQTSTNLQALEKLKNSLPSTSWTEDSELITPFLTEWRDRWQGHTPLLLMPENTKEVSLVVTICAEYGLAITTQGGNTGLVGGQTPQGEVLLSTRRLNKIRKHESFSLTVDAGCVLQNIQAIADQKNQLFPLALASQGSATIGGLCSTNAGGVHVVRYGSMRDLVLGLEVVLADGSVLNTLAALKKDNTGYNMSPLFLGAEGTLGIITAVELKLFPKPEHTETLMLALESVEKAVEIFHLCKAELPDTLSIIELLPHLAIDFVTRHIPDTRSPFNHAHPWYVILEFDFPEVETDNNHIQALIEKALDKNLIMNAVQAKSSAQAKILMNLREHISEAQKPEGGSIKHDVSVPISAIPEFINKASSAAISLEPGCRPLPFGHIGDGNIHFNISQPPGMDKAIYLSNKGRMNRRIHDIAVELGGSISAEHGIGILKKAELAERADKTKLLTMKKIKLALDPKNILNPRVLFNEL